MVVAALQEEVIGKVTEKCVDAEAIAMYMGHNTN